MPYMSFRELEEFSVFEVWADAGKLTFLVPVQFANIPGNVVALPGGIGSKLPDEESLSNANLRLISGWLDNCAAEHANCWSEKLPCLPTRVIDVGSLDGYQKPRLVVTDGRPSRYCALSHCWGDQAVPGAGQSLRLLQSNLRELQLKIPTGSLPKTFGDAIETSRKLEIRYLWIDALCIIQDSKADWEYESARMNDVYECSYLTIVATSARSSTDGFLQRPDRQVVSLPYRDDADPTITGRFYLTRPLIGRSPWDLVDRTAWNRRGW